LVGDRVLTLKQLVAKMTVIPSQILGISKGTLSEGADADIAIIDPEKSFTVDTSKFLSRGKNSPFHGLTLKGSAVSTISQGKIYKWVQ
ncbi:MAG: dihydroorotase, partial [Nitrospiraceae bacterium]